MKHVLIFLLLLRPLAAPAAGGETGPLVIAHRGASHDLPEHTFLSWDRAQELNADYLELDVQLTRDGTAVVLHDADLARTVRGPLPTCSGFLRDSNYADLAACNVSEWFDLDLPIQKIPTLSAVLSRYGHRARYYIEIKDPVSVPGVEEQLLAALSRHDLTDHKKTPAAVIFQSFYPDSLKKLKMLSAGIPRIQLLADDTFLRQLESELHEIALYADGIGLHYSLVNRRLVEEAHGQGLVVHVWTVNNESEMRRLAAICVDGIFTDRPGMLKSVGSINPHCGR